MFVFEANRSSSIFTSQALIGLALGFHVNCDEEQENPSSLPAGWVLQLEANKRLQFEHFDTEAGAPVSDFYFGDRTETQFVTLIHSYRLRNSLFSCRNK